MLHGYRFITLATIGYVGSTIAEKLCTPSTFQDITLFGARILRTETLWHSGLSFDVPADQNHYAKDITNLDFCEVVITYEHPGYDDTINTVVWLPATDKWSGRLLGAGGGGFIAGAESNATLAWATSEGFAVVSTDGGHAASIAMDLEKWAVRSPGNLDWIQLQGWASTALDDAANLGKAIVSAFYGNGPTYSYFNGCSTGGRQGYQLAQRYPEQYDGILAAAPAIYWNEFIMQMFWPQAVMNDLGQYPSTCELEAIQMAAIEACDELDGLKDGIIALPKECDFDPASTIGQQYICKATNKTVKVTEAAARVADETWKGSKDSEGQFLWHGIDKGASFAVAADTTCNNGTCVGAPFMFSELWMKYFLRTGPDHDLSTVNLTVFEKFFYEAVDRYDSLIGTSNTNLKQFRKAGGKLLTWHGLADTCITPDATADYTSRVYALDPDARDYYRYFEAPGVDHCGGGSGWYPGDALNSLIDWVEKGIPPETLLAETQEGMGGMEGMEGMDPEPSTFIKRQARLCVWPKSLIYVAGDPNAADSFECR